MSAKRFLAGFTATLLSISAYSCDGGDDEAESRGDAGGGNEGGAETDAADDAAAGDGAAADAAGDANFVEMTCGNGVKDELEECDDGNFNDWDGCTTLCELTCTEHGDCDDLNPCNGEERCTEDNACDDSDPDLENGEECGNMRSCWEGICVDDVCGDGIATMGETCDDGNIDAEDGCTPECEFTCTSNKECRGGDECGGSGTCDTEKHICLGDPLPDESTCDDGDGWCMGGVCVPYLCGDGKVQAGEDCDEGRNNGKPGSECSIECTTVRCGNGIIEGNEDCDDGNDERLDGCEPECVINGAHRMTRTEILKDYVPEFCVHQRNQFGEAFSNTVEIIPGFEFDVLSMVNDDINRNIQRGEGNAIIHVYDVTDYTLRTSDDEVTVGVYDGIRARSWEEGPPLDFPFFIEKQSVNEDGTPARFHRVPSRLSGGGRVMSREPTTVELYGATGYFKMYDFMARVVVDTTVLSTPEGPPEVARHIKLPETHGFGDNPDDPDYHPEGIICGAMAPTAADEPIGPEAASFCCKEDGTQYRPCPDNRLTDECDSNAEVLRTGCWVCVGLDLTSDCSRVGRGLCIQIIKPIPYDVDTDEDGTEDAWSSVLAFEGRRIRVRGVSEE